MHESLAHPEQSQFLHEIDRCDFLNRKVAQLEALLHGINGSGFKSFNALNAELKENTIWLACDLISDIRTVLNRTDNSEGHHG